MDIDSISDYNFDMYDETLSYFYENDNKNDNEDTLSFYEKVKRFLRNIFFF